MMRLLDGRKGFKISLAVLVQYRRVTDTQPRCRSIYRAYYVARVKQEAQLMLTTGAMRLAVSRDQQTWYHFGSIATFR